jgi:osmotically-inducible protein OsmY
MSVLSMSRSFSFKTVSLFLLSAAVLAACTPVGAVAGGGAALGIASAQEGGIRGAADDIRIKALISDKWFRYDLKTFAKLNLTVDQGRVLITGVVQDPDARVEAVRLAWQVEGVQQVINEIRVADSDGLPGFVRDEWITTRLRTALMFDKQVQSINYSIETVQGNVYLMGAANSQAELDRVIEVARTIPNVQQVVSYVKLRGQDIPSAGATDVPADAAGYNAAPPAPLTAPAGGAVMPAPVDAQPIDANAPPPW